MVTAAASSCSKVKSSSPNLVFEHPQACSIYPKYTHNVLSRVGPTNQPCLVHRHVCADELDSVAAVAVAVEQEEPFAVEAVAVMGSCSAHHLLVVHLVTAVALAVEEGRLPSVVATVACWIVTCWIVTCWGWLQG